MDPITIPVSFLKQSARHSCLKHLCRVPVTETAGSLEVYMEGMLRFMEGMEWAAELGGIDQHEGGRVIHVERQE